jgi:hypothetical protein
MARKESRDKPIAVQNKLPEVFTYFDCTDYIDSKEADGPATPLLTFACRTKQFDPQKGLSRPEHVGLLLKYVRKQINVHGGYFQGELCQQLIYRLACLGFDTTIRGYGGINSFSDKCKERQIRALLSPEFVRKRGFAPQR